MVSCIREISYVLCQEGVEPLMRPLHAYRVNAQACIRARVLGQLFGCAQGHCSGSIGRPLTGERKGQKITTFPFYLATMQR